MARREVSKFDTLEKIGFILSLLVLCFIVVKSLAVSFTDVFSFDGAMNAQVARNLNRGLGYATSYPIHILFDGKIQTGPTVLLPVALFFKLFGESFFSGLLVNAIYLFLTATGILFLLRKCLKLAYIYTFFALFSFILTPSLFSYGFGLYGEIPALSFLILSTIFFSRFYRSHSYSSVFFSGLALGLSVLTKTVMLLTIPSILLVFLTNSLGEVNNVGCLKKKVVGWLQILLKPLFIFMGGFLIPLVSFEIYKVNLMGVSEYLSWWKGQVIEILGQAGVTGKYTDSLGIYDKFLTHLKLFHSYTGIPPLILILLLSFISIGFISLLYGYKGRIIISQDPSPDVIASALIIYLVTFLYFIWWLLITPTQKAWYRRILNGSILLEIGVIITVALLTKTTLQSKLRPRKNAIVMILHLPSLILITHFLLYGSYNNLAINFANTPEKVSIHKIASLIRSLPENSKFYGVGWWQAPAISFAADKNFSDLFRSPEILIPGEKKRSFLVADLHTLILARKELNDTLDQFVYNTMYQDNYGALFELKERKSFDYSPFTEEEKTQLPSSVDFTQDNLLIPTRNVYLEERNPAGKWAQNISAYLLGYRGQSSLYIRFTIPDLSKYARNTLGITIYINKEKVYQQSFNVSGSHEIIVPLNQASPMMSGSALEITIVCDNTIAIGGDTRQLSLFLNEVSLKD
jgi:hypothetical protein